MRILDYKPLVSEFSIEYSTNKHKWDIFASEKKVRMNGKQNFFYRFENILQF